MSLLTYPPTGKLWTEITGKLCSEISGKLCCVISRPVDQELFKSFFQTANNFAPVVSILRSIHHVLSHKESVRKAIALLPDGPPLGIFVVTPVKGDVLLHSDIEGYCSRNNINYPPNQNEALK
jgi:hypothetical protein